MSNTPNTPPRFTLPPARVIARYALVAFAVFVVAALLIAAGPALVPFIVGLVLAYLIAPLINRFDKRLPRWAAILIVYAIVALVLVAIILLVVPPLLSQLSRLVFRFTDPDQLQSLLRQALAWYEQTVPPQLQSPIESTLQNALPALQENITTILQGVGSFLLSRITGVFGFLSFFVGFLVVPIWLFYLLNDSRRGKVFFNRLLDHRIRPDVWNSWALIDRTLSAFIRGQLTLGVIIGAAVWLGLVILDFIPGIEIDYILVLALWAGVAELVPMIGALLGAIPAVIVAFIVGGPVSAVAVLILFIIIQFIENNFLVPRVIGESVGVHPAILLVAIIVLGADLGFIGVIAAAPITAIARDLYLYAYRRLSGNTPAEAIESISLKAEQKANELAA
jgi:predicted PurR-regulated permease PerM